MDSIDPNFAKNNFPEISQLGYQIERELGHNKGGGRVTYLATKISPEQGGEPVVIKQFQFARVGASWSDYEAHEREIALLQQLDSPSIPKYLDSFETPNGFCLVQEYKNAPSLARLQQFTPEEIKQIAIAVLEVLVYLQSASPPIIHRDIKPENILIERSQPLKVYLVDFGLARQAGGDVAASSAVKGTLGFMPPEQLFNRQLTEASDLYSLGATLICLLTNTPSSKMGNLVDENYRINVKLLLPLLSPQFLNWLSKMVEPNLKNRYPNAATALKALESIDVVGKAITSESIGKAIKRLSISKALLVSLGLVALCSTSLSVADRRFQATKINNSGNALNLLQETRQCRGCNLRGADLRGMNLRSADLTDADLTGANLTNADLRSSYLKNVDLTEANLTNADLRGAYLENAILTGADIEGANLRSTDLRGAALPDGSVP